MTDDQALPAVRPLEATPFQNDEQVTYVALRDMTQISPQPIAVSVPGYFVITQLDGRRSVEEVQQAFLEQFDLRMPVDQIMKLVNALDDALMLDNERFEAAYGARRDAYLAAPARDSRARWPKADVLREQIERMVAGGTAANGDGALRGLIAPHLDYDRGAPCYADAYATLKASEPAERYVILGTNHFGRSTAVVGTRKDFQTPFGVVRTDRAFLSEIEVCLDESVCKHEFDHQNEHSIELQVQILQVTRGAHPFEIVSFLCPDPCGPTGTAPVHGEGPDLGDFADALAERISRSDRRTVLIAGADLSHVGQRFGDPDRSTPEFLENVRTYDERLLRMLEGGREEDFLDHIRARNNQTRICSAGCIYTLARALSGQSCRVLRYHQAVDMEAETHVTCAAAVVG